MRYAAPAFACLALLFGGCGGGGAEDPPSGAQVTTGSGLQSAEASIEGFGEEAEGSVRERLLATFHGYLAAIAAGDEKTACAYLTFPVRDSLDQLTGGGTEGRLSCPESLVALLSPDANQIARGEEQGQIRKVRADGDTAFVVFHAPGARLFQLNMAREGDDWKVASLSASVLAPLLPR